MEKMNIIIDFFRFGLDNSTIDAWFGGMYKSFFSGLENSGCQVTYSKGKVNKHADILVAPVGGGQDKTTAQAMDDFQGPVVLNVGSANHWLRKGFLRRWHDRILFVYGTDQSQYSVESFANLGVSYYHIPFASNNEIMHPLDFPTKLYDVVFVGNPSSGHGRHKYVELLMRSMPSRKILFLGPGWARYGFPSQSIAWGELLNIVYNLSNICVNIHNDKQKAGGLNRLDANNRLFDLAMAGCFQVSNAPQIIRGYFDESEVVAVDSPEDWVSTIKYYLEHPSETETFKQAARKRALSEHTWDNRAALFVKMTEKHLSDNPKINLTSSHWTKICRSRDIFLPPYSLQEIIQKLKSKIIRRFQRSS